jgi:hypothetical protein
MNQIWLLLGLKPEGFRAGMKKAVDDTKEFEKGWKGLAKIFAAGGITTVILGFLKQMASEAQATRAELEKLGQPIPQAVTALATLGDAFDGLGKISGTVVGTILSGWKQLFDVGGSLINRMRGISEAQENIAAAAAKGAEEQEAALAKARAENSPEKIKAAQKGLDDYRRKAAMESLDGEAKMSALLQENIRLRELAKSTDQQTLVGIQAQKDLEANIVDIRKLDLQLKKDATAEQKKSSDEAAKAAAHLAQEHERLSKAKFEGLSIDKQIETLDRSRAALEENIRAMKHDGLDTTTQEADLAEVINALTARRKDLTEQVADATARVTKEMEGQAEAARRTQQAYEAIMFGITNGGATSDEVQRSGDSALQEKIRRNNQQLIGLRQNPGGPFDYGNSLTILQLENENNRLQKELSLRNNLRNDVGFMGVEGARTQFKGDPLIFDRLVEQFIKGGNEDAEQTRLLRDIRANLRPTDENTKRIADLLDKGVNTVIQGNTG